MRTGSSDSAKGKTGRKARITMRLDATRLRSYQASSCPTSAVRPTGVAGMSLARPPWAGVQKRAAAPGIACRLTRARELRKIAAQACMASHRAGREGRREHFERVERGRRLLDRDPPQRAR